jgi:putative nucleotidyltransferase with HDIG domain
MLCGEHMHQLIVVGDRRAGPSEITAALAGQFEVKFHPLDAVSGFPPGHHTLIDVDLDDATQLLTIKEWLNRKPKEAKIVFVTSKASRLQEARAAALGGTGTIHHPIDRVTLLSKLRDGEAVLATVPAPEKELTRGVAAATDALQSIFLAACSGGPVEAKEIQMAANLIVDQLAERGLSAWIDTVRMHHSQTYQHCLLVTGVAAAFGEHIGASRKDRERLSFAGMLHDVGKARIPLAILEKPGRLDQKEMAVMRKHPEYGLEALAATSALPAEMLDMVVHHHELLDGSGYPHGLQASEISDLVRIMTISDVFGALIEKRSYKPPMSSEAAYQILLDMGPKLDRDLVRAFKFASRAIQPAAA